MGSRAGLALGSRWSEDSHTGCLAGDATPFKVVLSALILLKRVYQSIFSPRFDDLWHSHAWSLRLMIHSW